ncbi:DNA-binding response regulator, OmpR family, contains REC and winged-helix (wHTH) domain [Abditibacterium utsteinense]|uniref:DNA-binding response regulator, OmpR family, contains REC and winged-helix (WHTH) domain n=1 Tax=Abditibacterium utsteinense TaxID=1960156 RepID=A0A2S8SNS3_9BACT|nr:response regulator transcription factor [Abditibacterium utsteinense]PQV62440.1 DNA-binding response regulator, OmpR family, contains REC and winged-helix (wHTH) domain [Abditibacterium utsteinense]
MNVLIVEDEAGVSRFLRQACEEAGYAPHIESDGARALSLAQTQNFDLILLDVMLPTLNGFEVCRALRDAGIKSLILMITARDTLEDKIEGLDAGADDYVCKPFRVAEILARMRALLRRRESSSPLLHVGDLTLDPATRKAQRGPKEIPLSATEYSLLEYLMRNAGKTLQRSLILDHVWQYDFAGNDNVLDVYIGYLRTKIDKGQLPLIHTSRGVGYRLGLK